MSSTHRKKIARALAAKTGITYQQALAMVVAADENNLLPRPLDETGIRRAVDMLTAQTGTTPAVAWADLGFDATNQARIIEAMKRDGLILFTGPGTAKTIALNACLAAWSSVQPPDSEATPPTTFAEGLASILRHERRALSFGTITDRDQVVAALASTSDEVTTAFAAVQGHSVGDAVDRLITEGADPHALASALTAVVVVRTDDEGATTAEVTPVTDSLREAISREHAGPDSRPITVEDPAEFASRDVERPDPRADLSPALRDALEKPGLIIAAGPTGSGKSTVLYEAVRDRLRGQNKIITIEDPVEVRIHPEPDDQGIIIQRQVDRDYSTFERLFKSARHQDPDVLLIGEVRDGEHAAAAVLAATTGALVLSAVHANGPSGVVHRLIRLGVSPAEVAATLKVVVTTWQEQGQFYSTTWPVTDIVGSIIRHQHALPTFDAELRRAFGEEPAPEPAPEPIGPSVSRAARLGRSERVLDVIKAGPDKRPSIGHVLVTPPCGNLLLTGPTGSGKSVIARQAAAMHGIRGERVIVIDTVKGGADYEGLPVEAVTDVDLAKSLLASFQPENPTGKPTLIVIEEVRTLLGGDNGDATSVYLRRIMADSKSSGVRVVATSQEGVFVSARREPLSPRDFDTRVLLGAVPEHHPLLAKTLVASNYCDSALAQGWAFVESSRCETGVVNLWGKDEDKPLGSGERPKIKTALQQMSVMLHVGVDLVDALHETAASAGTGETAAVFHRIGDAVRKARLTGDLQAPIARAMTFEPHAFEPWVVKTVETAEDRWRVGGDSLALPKALERIAATL